MGGMLFCESYYYSTSVDEWHTDEAQMILRAMGRYVRAITLPTCFDTR